MRKGLSDRVTAFGRLNDSVQKSGVTVRVALATRNGIQMMLTGQDSCCGKSVFYLMIRAQEMSTARFNEFSFDGSSKIKNWNPPQLKWITGEVIEGPDKWKYDKTHSLPDIVYWYPGCLVLSPKATSILEPLFKTEAEFLPVPVENEKNWTILNIINMQDILDKANSRYHIRDNGTVSNRIIEAAISIDKLSNSKLFRIPGLNPDLFTSDAPESFKEVVESHGLTGLEFDEY